MIAKMSYGVGLQMVLSVSSMTTSLMEGWLLMPKTCPVCVMLVMVMLPVGVAFMSIQVACADAYMLNTTLREHLHVEIITSANRQSMTLESFMDSDD